MVSLLLVAMPFVPSSFMLLVYSIKLNQLRSAAATFFLRIDLGLYGLYLSALV